MVRYSISVFVSTERNNHIIRTYIVYVIPISALYGRYCNTNANECTKKVPINRSAAHALYDVKIYIENGKLLTRKCSVSIKLGSILSFWGTITFTNRRGLTEYFNYALMLSRATLNWSPFHFAAHQWNQSQRVPI